MRNFETHVACMASNPVRLSGLPLQFTLEELSPRQASRILRRCEVASVQAHNAAMLRAARAMMRASARQASASDQDTLRQLLVS